MERTERNLKVLAGVMAALLVLFVAGSIYYWDKSQGLAKEKSNIEKQANSQLSAKSRNINNLSNQLATAKKDNQSLTGKMQEANSLLSQKDNKLQQLRTSNAYKLKALSDSMQVGVTNLNDLRSQTQGLTDEKESLTNQNTELNNQVASLNEKLQTMVPRNTLTVDGFRVVAIKRNDKETAKAKKVHTLTVSFTIPSELGLSGTQEVFLSLTDLQGNVFMTPLQTSTITSPDLDKTFPVHAVKSIDFTKELERVAFTIESVEDVKPGTYRASVYTKDNYLGSAECTFRDSFWFF